MIPLTVSDIAEITGSAPINGIDTSATVVSSPEFDSRKIAPGGFFLALPGASRDGHDFVQNVLEQGAALALTGKDTGLPSLLAPPVSVDSNSDVYKTDPEGTGAAVLGALGTLTRYIIDTQKQKNGLTVIGVTGSAGKTSTKDMLATIFSDTGETIAPPGSFNNEIGHPYTAAQVSESTEYLVAEMSARGVGHISHLAEIAPPNIGIILNVGTAHLGEFGGKDIIAQAKGELAEAVPGTGTVVLNYDDPLVRAMSTRTDAHVVTFSAHGDSQADYSAHNIVMDQRAYPTFTVTFPDRTQERVTLAVSGIHQVENALAAMAAGHVAGIPVQRIIESIQTHTPISAHRMDISTSAYGNTVIDDSYNANPESMRAGISALKSMQTEGARWAVLGPMGELGSDSLREHAMLGEYVEHLGIDGVITVGQSEEMEALAKALTHTQHYDAACSQDTVSLLKSILSPEDIVLVKASYSERLWEVADQLRS